MLFAVSIALLHRQIRLLQLVCRAGKIAAVGSSAVSTGVPTCETAVSQAVSEGAVLSPMSKITLERSSAKLSLKSLAFMFVIMVNVVTICHGGDELMQAILSSALVPFVITGRVYMKSPDRKRESPPI